MTSAVPAAGSTAELTRAMASKEQFVEPNVPRKIKKISFGIMPPHEMINNAEFQVHERTLYKMPERRPAPGGVLDARLGVSSKRAQCETCGLGLTDCVGHFGYIKLALPVFHIGYFKSTVQTLQCICKTCSRVLLPPPDKRTLLRRLGSVRMERMAREAAFRRVLDRCKRTRACPYCGADNGVVKKAPGSLKILHDPSPRARGADRPAPGDLSEAALRNELLKAALPRALDDLHPLRVSALLAAIPDADVALLDVAGRPEHALVSVLPVPPVCIRPSVEMDGGAGSNEDDLSMKLMQIVEVNNVLRAGLAKGLACVSLMENWDFLQVQCAMYINADLPGLSASYQMPGKPMRGFVQRLKGKSGRFRGNLSGKRVDFSGRTVISPDPNLAISEVAVPRAMASTLTFPETVTPHNLARLRALVFNGQSRWPGAAFVVLRNQDRVWLKYGDCRRIASELRPGDVVERHLLDGDVVLFNRQPSLHRMSIMAHTVRVIGPWRTLRFNESVCSPYNADFDGDEMNVHVPQTYEARAEALELMGVERNLKTPKSGEILVAATQDFLTAAWLITARDAFLTRAQFCQALAHGLGALAARSWLPPPAILKPVELWTGKQLFSLLLRPGRDDPVAVTMETAEKVFSMHQVKKGGSKPASAAPPLLPHMCPNDGYVAFRNSALLCGRLGKVTLGGGGISGLFAALSGDYSPAAAAEVMGRLARLSARQLGQVGFSIGLDDLTPAPALVESKSNTVQAGYARCDSLLEQYARGSLPLQPGCDAEQSLEAGVTGVLNGIRDAAARVCVAGLTRGNAALIMSQCGSKGSPINIAQMVACVGQQSVGGRRVPDGFAQRSLPHFARGDRAPAAKGFVANSFYSGLTPTEFFFHTMAGREGLVDTAVKTAETGYMSRRLMKALEDLYAHYDGTVRNAAAAVVQLEYGEDGMDPVSMEGDGHRPLALDRMLQVAQASCRAGVRGRREGGGEAGEDMDADEVEEEDGKKENSFCSWPPDLLSSLAPLPADVDALFARARDQVVRTGCLSARGAGIGGMERQAASDEDSSAPCSALPATAFEASLRDYVCELGARISQARARLGLPPSRRGALRLERLVAGSSSSASALEAFVARALERQAAKRVEPGSTVGAFGAQSIGEPGTQMTLKTFHFAGVASMNVTLGVPRLKEIVNAAKVISTPLIQVALRSRRSEPAARLVKGRLERTLLGSVCESISIVVAPRSAHVAVRLDLERCARLQLEIDARAVRAALLGSKLKLKAENVRLADADELLVTAPGDASGKVPLLNALQGLEAALPGVIVQGLATVARAVVRKEKEDDGREAFSLVVEGTNLRSVLATPGVDGAKTTSNHVAEVALYVGIEAARATVIKEIAYTMGQHGMAVDPRHIMLMADAMTHRGEVLGITRFGIAKMKDSVLMLASFEKTTDHLFDAALRGRVDDVTGVSESIIMGIPMPTGTGLFGILHKHTPKEPAKLDEASALTSPRPTRAATPERCSSAAVRLMPLRQRPEPLLAGY